jgi:hypothetical protein
LRGVRFLVFHVNEVLRFIVVVTIIRCIAQENSIKGYEREELPFCNHTIVLRV